MTFAKEVERGVAERTAELATTIEQLQRDLQTSNERHCSQ